MSASGEDDVEQARVLTVSVSDHELRSAAGVLNVHDEVPAWVTHAAVASRIRIRR
jgi:hypothetical protein